MKLIGLVIVIVSGSLLIYATADFPPWGDPTSPASSHVSPRYIEQTLEETSVPNAVTAVLADYRGFDTMFETVVIFTAGVACFMLLRAFGREEPDTRLYRHLLTGITVRVRTDRDFSVELEEFERIDTTWIPYDLIIRTLCRRLIPFIQLFGLYVIAHGHHSPGGGFQGGVILGASIILLAVAHNLKTALEHVREKADALLCATGVTLYAATGAFCVLLGLNFLNYTALAAYLPGGVVAARSHGIFIVEVGVGMAVMATMIWIYMNVSSEGRLDEGL